MTMRAILALTLFSGMTLSAFAQTAPVVDPGSAVRFAPTAPPVPYMNTPPVAPIAAPANRVAMQNGAARPIPASPENTQAEQLVQLNFPTEIELETLVEYVTQRLEIKILFDESIATKKIRVRSSGDIPVSSLLQVLQSALKMKDLTLVDAEVPGWKRIVPVAKLGHIAQQGDARQFMERGDGAVPVMQIVTLQYTDVTQMQQLIQPFLTQPGGTCTPVKEAGVLIIADYAENVLKATELIETLDKPQAAVVTEFLTVKNIEVGELSRQITSVLQARVQAGGQISASKLTVSSDPRTNQLILTGTAPDISAAKELVQALDVPSTLTTEVYAFQHVDAREIDALTRSLLDPLQEKLTYRSVVNRTDNSLVVTTTKDIHDRIVATSSRMNQPTAAKQSPMRFYKLNNTTVDEILATLRALQQMGDVSPSQQGKASPSLLDSLPGSKSSYNHISGAVTFPLPPGEPLPPLTPDTEARPETGSGPVANAGTTGPASPESSVGPVGGGLFSDANVRITGDSKSNTVIIVAEPQVQEYYAKLIEFLDRRSPQVLIEAKIVTLDTSDEFTLGVEVSGGDRLGARRLFAFSSFGLSTPDPVSGALALKPGIGFNGTLVDPETADVIVRALSGNSRAKVIASPRILVNDNEDGRLQSVLSIPYTSVNSSQVVQSTSLGGNQDAGTTVAVTPHIGDGDHLQLNFAIEFSSFGQSDNSNLPPPRHVDQVSSVVTIPDGYTVIVGGLNRQNFTQSMQGVPFLDRIPILKYLASIHDKTSSSTTLFVFIKPIILRDDKFKDLKFLSDREASQACIQSLPQSCPILIK